MAPFVDGYSNDPMHKMGRWIMRIYPVVITVRGEYADGKNSILELLKAHKYRTDVIINDIGKVDTIQFRSQLVPWTVMDGELPGYGAYFFFPEDSPHALEFKLKYASG